MKCRTWLPVALLVVAMNVAAEERDLIIVSGQSNAVGYDALPSELPKDDSDKNVLFWWRCGDPPPDEFDSVGRKWTHLQPQPRAKPQDKNAGVPRQYGNFAHADGGFGPEIGLARALREKEQRPLAILKVAFSGTGLRTDWNHADEGPSGACYRALVSEARAALAAAEKDGVTLRLRAFVWVQGESDSNPADAPKYEERLTAMLAALRKDLAAPQLIGLLGVNTKFGNGQNPHVAEVVKAQQAVAAKDKRCLYVDTAGCDTLPPSHTHFTAKGTLEMGQRYAAALMKVEDADAP